MGEDRVTAGHSITVLSERLTPTGYPGFEGARVKDRPAYRDDGFWDDPRRRAKAIFFLLAMAAALVAAIMVFFVGASPGRDNTGPIGVGTATQPTVTPSHTVSTTRPAIAAKRTPSTSAAPKPTSTANPCPSATPCPVPGDNGGAVAALNSFRAGHGRSAVPGAASEQAQRCAVSQGDGPTCQPHYAWQPVARQDGVQAINKIAQQDGGQWLLDPAMSSFSVGWAYTPGANGGPGTYQVAVLKVG
jgi:hypothetical protein